MPDRGGGAAPAGMADWLAVYRRQGCPPVHHSPAYREAYDPHYRVLRTAYGGYFPALLGGGPAGAERQTSRRGH